MKKFKIKTVVVDDETRALNRMKILLSNFPEIEILALLDNSNEAIDFILQNEPDLVFLDIEMPLKTGLEVADELHKNSLHTKIIFISSYEQYAIKAIKNNAFDYLLKPICIDELKDTIERYKAQLLCNLNKREYEVISLIAKGQNSKEIGNVLSISHHTVDTYRTNILEKTDCKNAAELIMYAAKNNLI
jgi:two-component system LytT family response regulator/two-component system response regulator LytT